MDAGGRAAGKKLKGRKRHLAGDTLGLLLAVTVPAASVQNHDPAAAGVAQACTKASAPARMSLAGRRASLATKMAR